VSATSPATKICGKAASATCSVGFTLIEWVWGLYRAGERVWMSSPRGVPPVARNWMLDILFDG